MECSLEKPERGEGERRDEGRGRRCIGGEGKGGRWGKERGREGEK